MLQGAIRNPPPAMEEREPPASPTTTSMDLLRSMIHQCLACHDGGAMVNTTSSLESTVKLGRTAAKSSKDTKNQAVELQGVGYIGLGAVVDELTPKERVYDTLQVFDTRADARLVNILEFGQSFKNVQSVPLEQWNKERKIARANQAIIDLVRNKDFRVLLQKLTAQFAEQRKNLFGKNLFLIGITAHNIGVAKVLAGESDADQWFQQAIELKRIVGKSEVGLSTDEYGIQQFAKADFDGAIASFREAQSLRRGDAKSTTAMTLNNIACCEFQQGLHKQALATLEEAKRLQDSVSHIDLDLLHVAVVYSNIGYLRLAMKQYEQARSILEEALMVQQSVLDDNHRCIRDTMSNLEVCNAFHS